jgi:hypothetical protein
MTKDDAPDRFRSSAAIIPPNPVPTIPIWWSTRMPGTLLAKLVIVSGYSPMAYQLFLPTIK